MRGFDRNGPVRSEYRRYNINGITPGDDYAAMNQVLRRRYGKALEEDKIPDVIFIDGGKGQLGQAKEVFSELDVPWDKHRPLLLGIAKGSDRKAGLETLFYSLRGRGFLYLLIHLRCTLSSIFVMILIITRLRGIVKRAKVRNTSSLETIEGVGPKRRQTL